MKIRESIDADKDAIGKLHKTAFEPEEADLVSRLALELLQDSIGYPILSLVAVAGPEIVGHIVFSPVRLQANDTISIYILAPLAVLRENQKQGVGTKLIQQGMKLLQARDVQAVLVYGDPNYYSRTGFHSNHKIAPPFTLEYPDAWMAQAFHDGLLDRLEGRIRCVSALSKPEYW